MPARKKSTRAKAIAPSEAVERLPSGGGGQSKVADEARNAMPPPPNDATGQDVSSAKDNNPLPGASSDGAGRKTPAAKAIGTVPAPSSPLDELAELQVRRKFYISATNKQTNAAKALVRRYLGWRYDSDDTERERMNNEASSIVAAALSGKMAAGVMPDLFVVRQAIEPMQIARDGVEKEMKRLVRTLPVFAWAKEVRGFGELGLAVVLAEAGDLAKYPKKGHLWKRLGLAAHEGKAYSTWRREGGLTAEDWVAAGYSPRRRAEIFAVVSEPLFRHQSMSAGPYRAIYDRRRAATAIAHDDWSKGHSHADGLRIMTKLLIRDLWNAYRRVIDAPSERTVGLVPASPQAGGPLPLQASPDVLAGTHEEAAR
jgi:hypothetical protein